MMSRWIANHFAQRLAGVGRLEIMTNVMYHVTPKNVITMGGIVNINIGLRKMFCNHAVFS